MAKTITLSESAYKDLVSRLSRVEKMLVALTEKFEQEPAEGTEAWWEWSEKKADEDIRKGNVVTFNSVEEMQRHLDSLK